MHPLCALLVQTCFGQVDLSRKHKKTTGFLPVVQIWYDCDPRSIWFTLWCSFWKCFCDWWPAASLRIFAHLAGVGIGRRLRLRVFLISGERLLVGIVPSGYHFLRNPGSARLDVFVVTSTWIELLFSLFDPCLQELPVFFCEKVKFGHNKTEAMVVYCGWWPHAFWFARRALSKMFLVKADRLCDAQAQDWDHKVFAVIDVMMEFRYNRVWCWTAWPSEPRSWRVLMDLAIATCDCFDLSRSHGWPASCEFFEWCSFGQTSFGWFPFVEGSHYRPWSKTGILRYAFGKERARSNPWFWWEHSFQPHAVPTPRFLLSFLVSCSDLLPFAPIFQAFPIHWCRQYVRPLRTLMHCLVDTTKSFVWAMLLLVLMMCLAERHLAKYVLYGLYGFPMWVIF